MVGSEFCRSHYRLTDDERDEALTLALQERRRRSGANLPPLPEESPDDGLPENQRVALATVREEHASAFPECRGAAVITEPCGHGGTRFVCWGCREIIAGLGQSSDDCLDHFRIRAVDQESLDLLCSPLPPSAAQVEHLRRFRAV